MARRVAGLAGALLLLQLLMTASGARTAPVLRNQSPARDAATANAYRAFSDRIQRARATDVLPPNGFDWFAWARAFNTSALDSGVWPRTTLSRTLRVQPRHANVFDVSLAGGWLQVTMSLTAVTPSPTKEWTDPPMPKGIQGPASNRVPVFAVSVSIGPSTTRVALLCRKDKRVGPPSRHLAITACQWPPAKYHDAVVDPADITVFIRGMGDKWRVPLQTADPLGRGDRWPLGVVTSVTLGSSRTARYRYLERLEMTDDELAVALSRLEAFVQYYLQIAGAAHILVFVEQTPPWHFDLVRHHLDVYVSRGQVTLSPAVLAISTWQSCTLSVGLHWMRSRADFVLLLDVDEFVFVSASTNQTFAQLVADAHARSGFDSIRVAPRVLVPAAATKPRSRTASPAPPAGWSLSGTPLAELARRTAGDYILTSAQFEPNRCKPLVVATSPELAVWAHGIEDGDQTAWIPVNVVREQAAFFVHFRGYGVVSGTIPGVARKHVEDWAPYRADWDLVHAIEGQQAAAPVIGKALPPPAQYTPVVLSRPDRTVVRAQ